MRCSITQKVKLGCAKVWGLRELGLQGSVWSEQYCVALTEAAHPHPGCLLGYAGGEGWKPDSESSFMPRNVSVEITGHY